MTSTSFESGTAAHRKILGAIVMMITCACSSSRISDPSVCVAEDGGILDGGTVDGRHVSDTAVLDAVDILDSYAADSFELDATDAGDAGVDALGVIQCARGGDGSYFAAVRVEYEEDFVTTYTHYAGPSTVDLESLNTLRRLAQSRLVLTPEEVEALSGFRVRFDRSQCRVAVPEHGVVSCSTFDSEDTRGVPVAVDFLAIPPLGDATEEVVLGSMDLWVNLYSTSTSRTSADGETGLPNVHYVGTEFGFRFAGEADESTSSVSVYGTRCGPF